MPGVVVGVKVGVPEREGGGRRRGVGGGVGGTIEIYTGGGGVYRYVCGWSVLSEGLAMAGVVGV